jgi:hypothetical protein
MDEIIGQLAGLFLLVSALPIYMIARRKGVSTPGIIPWLRHLSISVRGSCGWDLVGEPSRQSIAGQN